MSEPNATPDNGFYWAVVGDSDEGEPIRVEDGHWYSTGCADPHSLSSVLILRKLSIFTPSRAQRAEDARMADLRERDYHAYRREYRRQIGHYPSHRRWSTPTPETSDAP